MLTPAGRALVLNGVISGSGGITKLGVGENLTINGANSYTGGTTLSGGRLLIGDALALGTGLVTQTQTSQIGLANPALSLTLANNLQLIASSLQILTPDVGQTFTLSGNISGGPDINLVDGNGGTVVLSGNNSIDGLVRVRSGSLGIGSGAAVNSAAAIRIEGGNRTITILAPDQTISTRLISHVGEGAMTATIATGLNNVDFAGALRDGNTGGGDTLAIVKTGAGIFTVSNASGTALGSNIVSGGFFATEGTLNLTGRLSGAVAISSGAALTGTGAQDLGTVTIADGATVSSGNAVTGPNAIGTLTFANLTLGATATTIFDLGVPSINTASPINDLIVVNGNLALGGAFNFNILPGFTAGAYRLMTYAGALSGGVTLGVLPSGFNYALSTGGGNIDLNVSLADYYWDGTGPFGNSQVDGGNGTWNAGNTNWTNDTGVVSSAWQNNGRAFFTANPGTVAVDGNFTYNTLFFTVDGYVLNPAAGATLGANAGIIDVSAASTATINVDLAGTNGLTKAGTGTLVLGGNNSFTGGLAFNAGTISAGTATALGAGNVTMAGGTTLVNGAGADLLLGNDFVLAGNVGFDANGHVLGLLGQVSGSGDINAYSSTGAAFDGLFGFGSANSFTGNITATGIRLAVVADSALGNAANSVTLNNARFETDNSFATSRSIILGGTDSAVRVTSAGETLALNGVVSGTALTIDGDGTVVLAGNNSYSSGTTISSGKVTIANNSAFGTGSVAVNGSSTLNVGTANPGQYHTLGNAFNLGAGSTTTVNLLGNSTSSYTGNRLDLTGTLTGSGALSVANGGFLVLFGNNADYSGNVTIWGRHGFQRCPVVPGQPERTRHR